MNKCFSNNSKCLKKLFKPNDEWHCQKIENKWIYIFKIFTDKNHAFSELLKVVQFIFVKSVSNALMNSTWTNSR
jgi:hypothetical protein